MAKKAQKDAALERDIKRLYLDVLDMERRFHTFLRKWEERKEAETVKKTRKKLAI